MAVELDLTNPSHLAALLDAALPGFEDQTPELVEPHIDALRKSDQAVFDHVGIGEQVDPNAPVQPDPQQQQQQQQQQGQQPLDLGGEGISLEEPQEAAELGGPPIYAVRGWTEIDRQRSKGRHEVYRLAAKHQRGEPIISEFTGHCQAVRVTLPRQKPPTGSYIGTWIGTVEAKDHLAFSIEEIEQWYAKVFDRERDLQRVDLITGARFRGRRFSPVSIYLGYGKTTGTPDFYFLEGGSASGHPEAMYCARHLDDVIHQQSGFSFTPFACKSNWYEGGLTLTEDKREPTCVYLTAAQGREGQHAYLRLTVSYERDRELRRVIHPFESQVEAAMRVLAIAEQAGCELRRGQGEVLEYTLGPIARAVLPWEERPTGHPMPSERNRYCGCPK